MNACCKKIILSLCILTTNTIIATYNSLDPLLYSTLEPQYPSYVSSNHLGLCLRSRNALAADIIVGTALMIRTEHHYSHANLNNKYKHVSIMGFKDGQPIYGRVLGKYALCNHSCDPNCVITANFLIKTVRSVDAHEELTVPYNAHIAHMPWNPTWNFQCECTAIACKKIINSYRSDIIHPATLYKINTNQKKLANYF